MKIYLHVLTSFIKDKVVYASDKHKHKVTYAGAVNKSNFKPKMADAVKMLSDEEMFLIVLLFRWRKEQGEFHNQVRESRLGDREFYQFRV